MKKVDGEYLCDKLINRFILRSKTFVDYSCFRYGEFTFYNSNMINSGFIDDFQYFAFTKSTKSLIAIRMLLKTGNVEDVFILTRTMFESYLACRYVGENYSSKDCEELIKEFLFIPQLISSKEVKYDPRKKEIKFSDDGSIMNYWQRNPSSLKLGLDENYYSVFYSFLCDFTHCNYSISWYYQLDDGGYTYRGGYNRYLAKVLILFVFTKLFETVVTVEGEEYKSSYEEKECYKLVKKATLFLYGQLDYLANIDCKTVGDAYNNAMKNMFLNMKASLFEELGGLKKDFLKNCERE